MDDAIIISNLYDFIFCPASIYFHKLYGSEDKLMYQTNYQIDGTKAHKSVDNKTYSTRKCFLILLMRYFRYMDLIHIMVYFINVFI